MTSGNPVADGIIGIIKFVIPHIIDAIKKWKKMDDAKKALATSFENSLNGVTKSYNEFLLTYFACYGAIISARNIRFLNAEGTADQLVLDLERKYNAFLKDFNGLLKLVKTHKSSLKDVFRSEDWIIMEIYLEAFKSKEPDWDFLMNNRSIQQQVNFKENPEFFSQFNLRLNLFSQKTKTPKVITDLQHFSQIMSAPSFFKCIQNCIFKRLHISPMVVRK